MIGQSVGSYRILSQLGKGGMGVVFVAEHALMGKRAAVKVLLPEFTQNADVVRRFFNEARSAAQIRHSGIVDVYDFGYTDQGTAYLVMELLDGESLAERLRREPRITPELMLEIAMQMASALGAAHDQGILHRDLKPDNVFLVPDKAVNLGVRVKILDFGIAKLGNSTMDDSLRTRTGTLLGTPAYMSPEQCRGVGALDARADIYSLGCILYEMACGQIPFVRDGLGEMISAHLNDTPPRPVEVEPSIDRGIEAVLLCTLAKNPAVRYPTMESLTADLEAVTRRETPVGIRADAAEYAASALAPGLTLADPGEPKSRTTLSGSAAQTFTNQAPEVTRRSRWQVPAATIGALLVLGAGVYAISVGGEATRDAATGSAAVPTPPPTPPLILPESVRVVIHSTPAEVDVFEETGETRLGATPFERSLVKVKQGKRVLLLKRAGYQDKAVTVALDRDEVLNVALDELIAKAVPAPPGPRPTRSPAPAKGRAMAAEPANPADPAKPTNTKPTAKSPAIPNGQWGGTSDPFAE